ncbi:MAG: TonB-dependent receptor [Bacteroidetes bacterium]|nr:MAG: TonB-dependent receptor [Bacteroidota bacterium]
MSTDCFGLRPRNDGYEGFSEWTQLYKLSTLNFMQQHHRLIIILFICLFSYTLSAQTYTISGFVSDSATGEKLISANVYDLKNYKGTVSNLFGFYSISLPANDTVKLVSSFIGYKKFIKKIILNSDKRIDIVLLPGQELKEVTVTADKYERIEQHPKIGVMEIPMQQAKLLPSFMGEVDIMKTIQLLPGVKQGREGTNGFYVRGGTPDQNLILLDDVPLYYVNHMGGFLSVFNADAISNVKLIKGGFPAKYGGRLSSVLDIRMKEGNMKKYHANATIGFISSKIELEGPIIKDKSSFIVSFRRCMLDLYTRPLTKLVVKNASAGYTFYDFNAKFNYVFSDKDRILLSLYTGRDRIFMKYKSEDTVSMNKIESNMKWGNILGALRWNHLYNHKLFSNLTLSYTKYHYMSDFSHEITDTTETQGFSNNFLSGIGDLSAKIDYDYFPSVNHKIKFGLNSIIHNFNTGITKFGKTVTDTSLIDTAYGSQIINTYEISAYIQDEIQFTPLLSANVGVHSSFYFVDNKKYYSVEPRIVSNYLLLENFSVKASFSAMKQYIHLLSNSGAGMPTDLWVPVSQNVKPQQAYQASIGLAHTNLKKKFEVSIDAYYKKMFNLIDFREGESFFGESQIWQDKVETNGIGHSYGIEFLLQKKTGKTTGWIAYTLSKTDRQFDNLNFGKAYPFKFDKRHDFAIVINRKIDENISLSATWVYATGNALTIPEGIYNVYDHSKQHFYYDYPIIDEYKNKNNFRMPSYHRLDFGMNFTKQKKHGIRTWNVSIYNVYNRRNPFMVFYQLNRDYSTQGDIGKFALMKYSVFQFIPSVSYSYKF